jgi:acetoacetyl-CoA reductase
VENDGAALRNRAAIVTGASRGIGRAIATRLASEGMSLVLGYLDSERSARALAQDLLGEGTAVTLVRGDIADPSTANQLVEAALSEFGRLDCLVNNAGITRDGTLSKLEASSYTEVLGVNLVGAALVANASIAPMIRARFGRIVNVASFVGQKGNFGQANYAASKAGLIAWTKVAAIELARHGITVNAVCPGFIETDMLKDVPETVRQKLLDQIPLMRFGRPEEVADVVAFVLASEYITGAQININGGIYM